MFCLCSRRNGEQKSLPSLQRAVRRARGHAAAAEDASLPPLMSLGRGHRRYGILRTPARRVRMPAVPAPAEFLREQLPFPGQRWAAGGPGGKGISRARSAARGWSRAPGRAHGAAGTGILHPPRTPRPEAGDKRQQRRGDAPRGGGAGGGRLPGPRPWLLGPAQRRLRSAPGWCRRGRGRGQAGAGR